MNVFFMKMNPHKLSVLGIMPMNVETIKNGIKIYIQNNCLDPINLYKLNDNDSFFENGIIDSVGVLELVAFVEETFHITIDHDVTLENLDSVNKLTSFIQSKINLPLMELHPSFHERQI